MYWVHLKQYSINMAEVAFVERQELQVSITMNTGRIITAARGAEADKILDAIDDTQEASAFKDLPAGRRIQKVPRPHMPAPASAPQTT